jgi:phytoene/squalene synthetase
MTRLKYPLMGYLDSIIAETFRGIDFQKITDHPNILIAARFWEEDRYQAAKTIYRFMRYIDDMIDDRKALDAALSCMEKKIFADQVSAWIDCLGLDHVNDPFLHEVTDTIHRFHIPLHFFNNFARSMVYDIHHNGFSTFREFLNYTEGASNGPASVFVHLCCLEKSQGEYIPQNFVISNIARPCATFSYLVHIIRDFRKDQLNNLNYFALDILEKHGLTPADLKHVAGGGEIVPAFRNVVREYKEIAGKYMVKTEGVLKFLEDRLDLRYLLSLKIIFHLYRSIYDRIDPDKGTFSTAELNPTPEEVRESVLECIGEFKKEFAMLLNF